MEFIVRKMSLKPISIRGGFILTGGFALGELIGRRYGNHQAGEMLKLGLPQDSALRMMLESSDIGFDLFKLSRSATIKAGPSAEIEFDFESASPRLIEEALKKRREAVVTIQKVAEATGAPSWDSIRRQHDSSIVTTWDRLRKQNNLGPQETPELDHSDSRQDIGMRHVQMQSYEDLDDFEQVTVIPLSSSAHDKTHDDGEVKLLPRTREEVEAAQVVLKKRTNKYGDSTE
ncbi:hypothetical protein QVD99_003833 [Batrachochytrium dendrobatidis]|nr:hypothetical protein O5D80_004141 [Batrachochytrium dendrobatidis]KAK5669439.1 hypothetical protein QVD99_003833 [Batrachochytrium dendrobatidis]